MRTSYDIENQHFDDAKAHLADARIWAAKTPNPLASAWVSAWPSILVMKKRPSVACIARFVMVTLRNCRNHPGYRRLWIKISWGCAVILSTGIMNTPASCLVRSA